MGGGIRVNASELRYQKEKRVLTCKELAEEAGVAASSLYALKRGDCERARSETIRKLAKALHVKP